MLLQVLFQVLMEMLLIVLMQMLLQVPIQMLLQALVQVLMQALTVVWLPSPAADSVTQCTLPAGPLWPPLAQLEAQSDCFV